MPQGNLYHFRSENRYQRPPRPQAAETCPGGEVGPAASRRVQVRWRRNVLTAVKVILIPAR